MESFKQIDIHQAKELFQVGNAIIVDIRDSSSYRAGHIAKAVLVNDENLDEFLKNTTKDNPVVCYCYHGFSSQNAAVFFKENGFKDIYSIEGGFEAWRQVYPFVNGS